MARFLVCKCSKKRWRYYKKWKYCPYCGNKFSIIGEQPKKKKTSQEIIENYIRRYGTKSIEWAIEGLVKIGESFEEWYERIASKCRGAIMPGWKDKCRKMYEKGGLSANSYIVKHLCLVGDERFKGTVLWNKYRSSDNSKISI